MWEIMAHATNKLLVIGKDESGCCATQGREALVYFEVAMRWNELSGQAVLGPSSCRKKWCAWLMSCSRRRGLDSVVC